MYININLELDGLQLQLWDWPLEGLEIYRNIYLELDGLQLQVRDWPLVDKYLLQDAKKVLPGQEAGVVLLKVGDEVV